VSIEPHPSNFLKLRRNVRLNPSANVACFHLALSSKEELLDLEEINPGNSGTVRVYSADAYSTKETFTVAACTLQQVLENAKLQGVTLLKIDVEGFEFSVLEGLNWQGQYRPQNVLIEFSDYTARFGGSGRKSLAHFFLEKGYVGYTVQGQPLSPTESTVEDNAWFRDKALTAERQG
jgi:FkbM family methyltransferase